MAMLGCRYRGRRSQAATTDQADSHLLVEVGARLGVGDFGLEEGSRAHLDVHDARVVEVVQQVTHLNEDWRWWSRKVLGNSWGCWGVRRE